MVRIGAVNDFLVVGGPFDGQIVGMPAGRTSLRVPVGMTLHAAITADADARRPVPADCLVYRTMPFRMQMKHFLIMVPEGWTADEVFERMMKFYRPERQA